MQESEEENHVLPQKSKPLDENVFSMDYDIDFETSWPLDHVSNSMHPFFLQNISEQPFSPIWTFSDDDHNIAASGNNKNIITENRVENDDKQKHVTPHIALPPLQNPHGYCLIKERMTQALRNFKELTELNVLAQVWAPVRNGSRYKLTTSGQPFVLDAHSNGLHQYRTVSLMYMFSVDGENDEVLGLPGRVFQQKLPEWTPNVQYYSSKEYSRLNHALHYNVRGTLALPVFEPPGQSCVAVLELIMTSQKINYAPEVDKVCKALEAVNLRSSEILEHPYSQICNEDRQNALSEILEILTVVCETHNLPLAQTWVPCRHRSVLAHGGGLKKNCSSFDGYCMGQVCMSITEVAFYIIDSHTWGFHDACVEHHLQQGQGVAGRAFLSQNMCFCGNITQFCKTDYPLVHYALMFDLTSSFSICLQSSHTGSDDYVLEFFLPPSINKFCEQKGLLGSILATMKQNFQSLKVASGVQLEEDGSIEIVEIINGTVHSRLESVPIIQSTKLSARHDDASPDMEEGVPLDQSRQKIITNFDDINDIGNLDDFAGGSIDQIPSLKTETKKKPSLRKRGKAEKSISLEVLQDYFSGSLKDAAKSLGVCPTTMKRICRQHGISRWPSRKIKKVNRSLSKLKCVIESVHGVEGAFGLDSPSTSTLPIAAGSFNEPSTSNKFEHHTSLSIMPSEPKKNENYLDASKSEPQEPFGGMLIEGADSSKDLKNMCPSTDVILEDQVLEASRIHPPCSDFVPMQMQHMDTLNFAAQKEMKIVTIKATYRDDIIRFRVSLNCGIVELREEIAKRLKLEVGTFDIKYLDDDQEWILVACDADLQECMDILTLSGSNIIRLVVHDILSILGSSVESSGE